MAKTIAIKVDLQGTEAQKKKLAKLEAEVKSLTQRRNELNKSLKKGTISLTDYGKEIAKINTKLKANRREMLVARENILGLDSFTKKLGKSFSKLGTSIAGAFIGMFAVQKFFQVISDGVKTVAEFEQQMANVKAITGATAEEFAKLEKSAKELGASTQFTASEVGKLQEEYAKLGFSTQQILDASEATLELATATGSDLAQSAKVAAATINGFRLEAKDTQRIVDVMAKSFTSSALDLSKFEVAMSAVAPVAATVGMTLEETTASLGVLVDAGFDASTAGTALRNILLDTQKAGISVSEAFNQIKASADPSSAALDLFGKRGAAVAITLANSTDKTANFTRELKNAQGAAEAMARIVGDTLEGDVKRLNSAWEGLILNLGENGEDLFRDIVQGATDLISTLGDLTKNIHAESDAMQEQGVKVNALASRIVKLKEGDEERLKLLNELNILNPELLKGQDLQKVSNDQLTLSLKKSNQELIKNIILKREQEELAEQAAEVAEIERNKLKDEIKAQELLGQIRLKALTSIELANQRGKDTEVTKTRRAQLAILQQTNLTWQEQAQLLADVNQASFRSEEVAELFALRRSTRRLNEDLKEEGDILAEIEKRAEALEKRFGTNTKETEENTEEVKKNNVANTKRVEILEDINQELEEVEDPLDSPEFNEDDYKKASKDRFDFLLKDSEKLGELRDKEQEKEVSQFAETANKKLQLEVEFEKQLRNEKIALAEQTANALISVSNRRVERQKTLELAALDAQLEQGLISQDEFEKKREEIERKAFNKQKKLEIAQIAISLAREIASINANAAANPANAVTFGAAGVSQASVLTGLAVARSAVQAGIVASQRFAEGGYTGDGFGSPDSTGFKQAGVVHEGEYVVPKHVLESQRGGQLVSALESMRMNKPVSFPNVGFANGGFTSGSNMDLTDMENRISKAVISSIGAIQVQNVATDTTTEAIKISNIQSEASFG
ncbi:MAG: putative minor tail protein [Prokaryotic dsDNA virus sp.]|nr:MAG: putative minor tail protein [Prokaryotic dsDNA virus sp.]|tara:strand:- start:12812 stop:15712 length:2901 start_codon:yes stop_codon:yes gene_type:complete